MLSRGNTEDIPHASRTDMEAHGVLDSVGMTERRSMYNMRLTNLSDLIL